MKTRRSIPVLLAIAVMTFALGSCMTLKTIDIVGENQPKGFVSFYSPDLSVDIYRVEKEGEEFEAENHDFWQSYPELRVAKSPGTYSFRIVHQDYSVTFTVEVQPDMISYVSVNKIMLNVASNTSYSYGVYGGTTTTTTWTYNVSTTVGATPLSVNPGAGDTGKLLMALDDRDWGTRLFAVKSLLQVKLDPGPDGITKLQDMASTDRKWEVRVAAADLLKSLGAAVPKPPFFLETFDDNGRGWLYGDGRNNLQCWFNGLGYTMDNKSNNYTWATVTAPEGLKDLDAYDMEVEAAWMDGIDDNAFGVLLGRSASDFYDFCVSRNGGAVSHRVTDSNAKSKPIGWNNDHKADLATADSYRLKIEVRRKTAAYSVNGLPIGEVTLDADFSPDRIGLIIYYNQSVLFRTIKITAR
jgi:hypothetical protein